MSPSRCPGEPISRWSSSATSSARRFPAGECVVALPKYAHTDMPSSASSGATCSEIHADADSSFAARARPDEPALSARLKHDRLRAERGEIVGQRRCDLLFWRSFRQPRVDRDDLAVDRGTHRPYRLGFTHDRAPRSRLGGSHPFERRQRVDADDAVRFFADVTLELAHRSVGERAEQSVLTAGVEPQAVQLPLERADVVASVERRVEVERAITQLVARLDELAPRVGPDHAVGPQVAPLLEDTDGGLRRRPERAVEFGVVDVGAERDQPLLDASDLRTAVMKNEGTHANQSPPPHPGRQPSR